MLYKNFVHVPLPRAPMAPTDDGPTAAPTVGGDARRPSSSLSLSLEMTAAVVGAAKFPARRDAEGKRGGARDAASATSAAALPPSVVGAVGAMAAVGALPRVDRSGGAAEVEVS